jgi:hypothetical protein
MGPKQPFSVIMALCWPGQPATTLDQQALSMLREPLLVCNQELYSWPGLFTACMQCKRSGKSCSQVRHSVQLQ